MSINSKSQDRREHRETTWARFRRDDRFYFSYGRITLKLRYQVLKYSIVPVRNESLDGIWSSVNVNSVFFAFLVFILIFLTHFLYFLKIALFYFQDLSYKSIGVHSGQNDSDRCSHFIVCHRVFKILSRWTITAVFVPFVPSFPKSVDYYRRTFLRSDELCSLFLHLSSSRWMTPFCSISFWRSAHCKDIPHNAMTSYATINIILEKKELFGGLLSSFERKKRRHRQKNNCSSGGRKATILLAGRHSGPSNHPRPALWLGLSSPLNQYR